MDITVSNSAHGPHLICGEEGFRCSVGRGGIAEKSSEGDGVTPIGTFAIRSLLYRADRISNPATRLPATPIQKNDGWCDAPGDVNYNRPVMLPYPASAEHLWRDNHVYDLIVVLGFNDDPVVDGLGSAIFLHVARPDYVPTEGCVALSEKDLLLVLKKLGPGDTLTVTG